MGKILIGLVVIVAAFAVVVATRPSTFHIERSTTILARPEVVFAELGDFHAWPAWSPWEKLDPKMARTFSGPPAGVGATYAWKSEVGKVGQGRMTIEKSEPPTREVIKLEFIKPFAATNTVTFTIEPLASDSRVTWAMDGHNGFLGKMFHTVMDMDKMVGRDFERGLANLKTVVESAPKPAAVAGALMTP